MNNPDELSPSDRAAIEFIAQRAIDGYRDAIRAKVVTLRAGNTKFAESGNRLDRDFNLGKVFAYERVLALLDGGSE